MKKTITMGNALVDVLIKLDDDKILSDLGFARGSMVLVEKEQASQILELKREKITSRSTGGSAANTINGLARLGAPCAYIGKVGDDEYGEFFNSDLEKNKIKSTLFKGKDQTGKCIVMVSRDSERTMATLLGAAIELCASDLKPEIFQGYDYFHLEGYLVQNHDLIRQAVEYAKAAGNQIAIDLSSFNVVEANLDFLKPLVRDYIDIVFANEEESKTFTGKENPEEALDDIARDCSIAVVKIGKEGSLIKSGGEISRVSAIEAAAIDTTGAGDLYQAGFFYGLAKGYPLETCGKIGAITSGKVVEVLGAKMDEGRWENAFQMVAELEKG